MSFRTLTSYAGIMSLALLVGACGGGGGGGSPLPQTIAFATGGSVTGAVGTTVTNVASGGGGTGAITYASGAATVATVNSTTGLATLVGDSNGALIISTINLAVFVVAIALAWFAYGRDVLPGRSLVDILPYAFRKLGLYARIVTRGPISQWIRTDRN